MRSTALTLKKARTKIGRPGGERPPAPRGSESLMVNSVDKALKVLRAFDGSRRRLGLSQIAEAAGMGLSATQRFTYTLLQLGYLRRDEASRLSSSSVSSTGAPLWSFCLAPTHLARLRGRHRDAGPPAEPAGA